MEWLGLAGKVVAVTGGSSGLGEATAASLLAQEARVVALDVNPAATASAVETIHCDVTEASSVHAAFEQIASTYGRLDVLANFAGVNRPGLLVDYYKADASKEASVEQFDLQVAVNQKGPFLCAQAAARMMIAQRSGVIVNVSSEAGAEGSVGQSIYAATKGALNSFTLSWAKEWGRFGIRVVGVAPAINEPTPMGNPEHVAALAATRGMDADSVEADYTTRIPLGRPGRHHEIADLVTYLASDRASYITGTTIAVTGGKSRG
ncbi:sorbitol-6-phosphate dehydrogenase subunit [Glycomyces tenuis]|uniref:sorbitol-6-phosphate dehydrogenase subunit n=1 Tax=Glycomyces tenuis TaxID=58116 RepID=UPI0004266040|nr:sorbitol-6-phosphate dehydrogenase subunit [Glycomyces tenuis]